VVFDQEDSDQGDSAQVAVVLVAAQVVSDLGTSDKEVPEDKASPEDMEDIPGTEPEVLVLVLVLVLV